ncbi:MAG: hypothetical protein Ct9H300mP1_26600 [Planctomycetaceae bacterium]|nr:MAG: hypothetical protein Ct9H300mP1_26600 [Planctomycetaceae bacterium]
MSRRGLLFLRPGIGPQLVPAGLWRSRSGFPTRGGRPKVARRLPPVTTRQARSPIGAQPVVRVVNGKKWIGDVPQDIYFEDPLSVAADRRPVGDAVVAGDPKSVPAAKSAGTNKPPKTRNLRPPLRRQLEIGDRH